MAFAVSRLEEAHSLRAGRLRFEVQVETPTADPGAGRDLAGGAACRTRCPGGSAGCTTGPTTTRHRCRSPPNTSPWNIPWRTSPRKSCSLPWPARASGFPTVPPTSSRWGRTSKTPGSSTAGWSAGRWSAATTRGWDLHPAQLPSRFAATYAFYRQGLPAAAARLRNYVEQTEGGVRPGRTRHRPGAGSLRAARRPVRRRRRRRSPGPCRRRAPRNSPRWPTRGGPPLPTPK